MTGSTTPSVTATPSELDVLAQDIVEYSERIGGGIEKKFEELEAVFSADVWPTVKAAILLLASQEGQAALSAEVAAAPTELVEAASGNISASLVTAGTAVAAAITSTVGANATADFQPSEQAVETVLENEVTPVASTTSNSAS